MKLISMLDFVFTRDMARSNSENALFEIENYANFLKQPLTLGMFIPCVDNEPFNYSKHGNIEQHEKAKEEVLFEGCSTMQQGENTIVIFNDSAIWITWTNRIVEDLLKYRVILTESAIKQIGL